MVWGHAWRAGVGRATGAALTALALASCGGGQQVEKYVPARIVSFGDETSMILNTGKKYSVNAVDANTGAIVCKSNPIWNQTLAVAYGYVFPQCNPDAVAVTTPSEIDAQLNATVDMVASQIASFRARPGSFGSQDLVTILAGTYDVLAAYNDVKSGATTEEQATATVQAKGAQLAGLVNSVAQEGGKVLIATIPDLGTTPFGLTEDATVAGHAALLTRLTANFNSRLRINLINDGHMIGLILSDEAFSSIVKNPSANGYVNVTQSACSVALPDCTTNTLTQPDGTTASGDTWLWADSQHLSAGGQRTLGALAVQRATGNPF